MAPSTPSISDAAVQAKTGKTWPEWFALLDAAGAKKMSHQQIVALLSQKYRVGPWWQQMVTVAYEQARGLRQKHETPTGYQVSISKTVAVPVARLYRAWRDAQTRARWLGVSVLAIRKATENRSLRIAWVDGKTSVEVYFYGKGDYKSQVTVQHTKLANAREVARMKAQWSKALDKLKQVLE